MVVLSEAKRDLLGIYYLVNMKPDLDDSLTAVVF
jgi:hypothetical protein